MAKEAASIGSPHIEAEHLLLGVARAVEPDLKELLRLKELENTLRADLRAHAQFESRQTPADLRFQIPVRGFWPMLLKRLFDSTHRG